MEQRLPKMLKLDGNKVIYSGSGHLEFYIPKSYFTRGIVEQDAENVTMFGMFPYAHFDSSGKASKLLNFSYPTTFVCRPSDIQSKRLKLTQDMDEDDYNVLYFYQDAIVMYSYRVPNLVDNMELYMKMLISGALLNNIKYEDLYKLSLDNAEYNKKNYRVPASIFGIIISEQCRSINDLSIPYRLSKSTNPYAYKLLSLKDLPNYVSAFAAFNNENWDASVTNSILNKSGIESPLEKSLME